MAANMKAVKLRIKSVESTMQITKLWNLWRPPSCERPRSGRNTCRPYFQELYRTFTGNS